MTGEADFQKYRERKFLKLFGWSGKFVLESSEQPGLENAYEKKLSSFWVMTQEAGDSERPMLLCECAGCSLVFADDFAADRSNLYGAQYATWGEDSEDFEPIISQAKRRAFRAQLKHLTRHADPAGKKLLDVGTGAGYLLDEASKLGFDCFGSDISVHSCEHLKKRFSEKIFCGSLFEASFGDASFDVVCFTDVLEHLTDPVGTLLEVKRILKPGGLLFIISPNAGSLTRKLFGARWFQYKYEHVFFFNRLSLSHLFKKCGLELVDFRLNRKKYSLGYYLFYFKKYRRSFFSAALVGFLSRLPDRVLDISFSNPVTGEFLAIAKKKE